jgi:hypothetical protein
MSTKFELLGSWLTGIGMKSAGLVLSDSNHSPCTDDLRSGPSAAS